MRYLALLLMLPLLFSFGCTKKTLAGKLEGKWISTPDISRMYNAGYTILEIKGSGYLEYTIKDKAKSMAESKFLRDQRTKKGWGKLVGNKAILDGNESDVFLDGDVLRLANESGTYIFQRYK